MALVSRRRLFHGQSIPNYDQSITQTAAFAGFQFAKSSNFGIGGHFSGYFGNGGPNINSAQPQISGGLLSLKWRNQQFGFADQLAMTTATSSTTATRLKPNFAWDEQEIGCGGYGVVWVVRDPRNGRKVALKKMADIFCTLGHSKRAYRELRLLRLLKHENVLTCCEILEPSEKFKDVFVVSELMETDLQRIIVSSQPLASDHIRIFMYQILRGMKYLHSAKVLHRDLKPSNILVNSNCFLKICDFGLSRIWNDAESENCSLTQEVVTEYYRAPELLMGAVKYNSSADVWSIGCIFAELLGRRIQFLANGPLEQLNMIIELLGTPTWPQMKYACEAAKAHVLRLPYHPPNLTKFYSLSSRATTDAVDLLVRFLKFDPDERISIEEAIEHNYLHEARVLFHSCMCSCCSEMDSERFKNQPAVLTLFRDTLEPKFSHFIDDSWEKALDKLSIWEIRRRIYDFIIDQLPNSGPILTLNANSIFYQQFIRSTVIGQDSAD